MKLAAVLLLVLAAGCADASQSSDTSSNTETSANATAADSASGDTDVTTKEVPRVAPALVMRAEADSPLAMAWRTGDDSAYIAEKRGVLVAMSADYELRQIWDFSDQVSSGGEQGFLGLTFSTDGEWLYLSYTDPVGDSVLAVVPFDDGGPDFEAEQILIGLQQPYANHNGGDVHFGPDGYLYWGLGDGGSGGDPEDNGQNSDSLLGSMLRIEPVPAEGNYRIPSDNPFRNEGGAPEIWLTGLRNPWRFSFDAEAGDLWIGDVGQSAVEEINLVRPDQGGANLGWNECEGDQDYEGSCAGFHAPIYTYTHSDGVSVTGGYVYRGAAIPQLVGQYIFADYSTATIWGLDPESGERFDVGLQGQSIAGFAQDPAGELWVLSLGGAISQIATADQ